MLTVFAIFQIGRLSGGVLQMAKTIGVSRRNTYERALTLLRMKTGWLLMHEYGRCSHSLESYRVHEMNTARKNDNASISMCQLWLLFSTRRRLKLEFRNIL